MEPCLRKCVGRRTCFNCESRPKEGDSANHTRRLGITLVVFSGAIWIVRAI